MQKNYSTNIYLRELDEIPHVKLSNNEEVELIRKIQSGDKKAYKWFVENNLRLVLLIAKKYTKYGVSLEDLIGEGNLGLLNAIKSFDDSKGTNFSVYASIYVEGYIKSSINKHTRIIRLPSVFYNQVMKYKYYKENYNYTDEQIARKLKVKIEKIEKIKKYLDNTISINNVDRNNEEIGLKIKDDQDIEAIIYDKLEKEELAEIIGALNISSIKKEVIYLRYGLKGKEPLTLEATANILGLTSRQRVQQIEAEVINNLKEFYMNNEVTTRIIRQMTEYPSLELDFSEYSEIQIKEMLKRLSDTERFIFKLRYTGKNNWNDNLENEYVENILPKVKQILKKIVETDINNVNLIEFLNEEEIIKIAYSPDTFTAFELNVFKKIFNDSLMQEVLYELYYPNYPKILKSRLGINRTTCLKIWEISKEYNLYNEEVSNILYNILIRYKNKLVEDMKKRCK